MSKKSQDSEKNSSKLSDSNDAKIIANFDEKITKFCKKWRNILQNLALKKQKKCTTCDETDIDCFKVRLDGNRQTLRSRCHACELADHRDANAALVMSAEGKARTIAHNAINSQKERAKKRPEILDLIRSEALTEALTSVFTVLIEHVLNLPASKHFEGSAKYWIFHAPSSNSQSWFV